MIFIKHKAIILKSLAKTNLLQKTNLVIW